jgi:DNA-binding transcriptional MerR regulator
VEVDEGQLTIGAFSRASRLSTKALRVYEQHGILVPASVDDSNGYRRYDEMQLRDARLVRMLRRLDMPLAQVAAFLAAPFADRSSLLDEYWSGAQLRIQQQQALVARLQITLSGGRERYPMYEVTVRDVPTQTVLTEKRRVRVAELPDWIAEALGREHVEAAQLGGAVGAPLVIYHGEVNEDGDGPVECVTPIDAARATDATLPTRDEPAHREAYTRITKAQVRFPDIMSAYDAVESWIAANGKTIVGFPREVYFADFDIAGPDDECVDIAFVIAD